MVRGCWLSMVPPVGCWARVPTALSLPTSALSRLGWVAVCVEEGGRRWLGR